MQVMHRQRSVKGTVTQQIFPGSVPSPAPSVWKSGLIKRDAARRFSSRRFSHGRELETDADESSHKLTFLANAMIWGFSDARNRFLSPDLVKNDSKNYKIRQQ
jgi:hypothetical protein